MNFEVTGEVLNSGTSKKNGSHFLQLLIERPDKSGKDVLLIFTKTNSYKAGQKITMKCSSFVKVANEV